MSVRELDDAIERSAAPETVRVTVDRLLEAHPDLAARLTSDKALVDGVVAVAGASRFLGRFLVADAAAVDVLGDLDRRPTLDDDDLARWKKLELLRIAARDLTGRDQLEQVGANLADLADDVLEASCRLADGDGLAVIAMGKHGGRELNYSSDIDVLFVGEGNARKVMDVARTCFRVDADLRPEGRDGPLVRTLESYEAYWDRWADTWEFQALLKARHAAGDAELGKRFCASASERVWSRPFGADELRSLREMKARAEGEIVRRGLGDREIKRGAGGIRDIEFAVQLLQMVHGRNDDALRLQTTLPALAELASAGYVDDGDARALANAYRFLRTVEHRLQLVEDQQVHEVPAADEARTQLARVLGYRDRREASALGQFDDELRRHQSAARSIHERLYFRPLLEAFAGNDAAITAEAAETRLAAFGFADADRTRQALRELTGGLTRSSRLMQQMLPLLLNWLSVAPDPDLGLLGLRTLAGSQLRATALVNTFRESPEAARRLCLLVGTSRLIIDAFERQPELIADLADDDALAPRTREDLVEQATSALAWRDDTGEQGRGLQRLKRSESLRIEARDILGLDDLEATGASLTALAEAALEAALHAIDPKVPMAIVAMGRFGGEELSYASDLDVLVVFEGTKADEVAAAEHAAEALMRFVNGPTPSARIYALDADLRPEGKQGPLARSLDGYRTYYERWAQTWERQALVRARPVAGDLALGQRFMEVAAPFVWNRPLTDDDVREIRRMKARVERERIPAGDDPQFHLKLGRGSLSDVEWTAQLLQLQHRVGVPGTMAALRALVDAGALDPADADVLATAYRFCERTRNRWYLVKGSPGDALPAQADQLAKLARSLGMSPSALRNDYRRVTRRAREVMERVFYGRVPQ